MVQAVVGGRAFEFSKQEIETRMAGIDPEPIREHLVEIHGVQYPPKQVLAAITTWQRTSFTTMEAQRVLLRAGFVCRRNGNMALGGPKVFQPLRPGELGRIDEVRIHVGRVSDALVKANEANATVCREVSALDDLLSELMNDQSTS